jgi:nitroimidazol reductase NimA-like FMN-containing flavoprotein (pyridoxamine 5'-phosphate oxidase superfamily)
MTVRERWFPSHVRDMSLEECQGLLKSKQVGRIGFTDPDGPVVLPVNYVLVGDCVVVATSAYSSLGRNAMAAPVAFEVDEIDDFTESGWSVLVRGQTSVIERHELSDVDLPQPWAEGTRTLILKISVAEISGRRLIPT